MLKKLIMILSLVLYTVIVSSFKVGPASNKDYYKKKWIPEDFDPQTSVLLIEEHPYKNRGKWESRMEEWILEEYPWKYEILDKKVIAEGSKYQDHKKYPYALLWSDKSHSAINGSNFQNHDLEGHFLNLSTKEEFPDSGYALNRGMTAYKKIISVIIKWANEKKDKE